jgi:hypothetical protein
MTVPETNTSPTNEILRGGFSSENQGLESNPQREGMGGLRTLMRQNAQKRSVSNYSINVSHCGDKSFVLSPSLQRDTEWFTVSPPNLLCGK